MTYTTVDHATNPPREHETEENARGYARELTGRAQGECTVSQHGKTVAKYADGAELER